MILLDTNVLSALMQPAPPTQVVAWLDSQPERSIWTTAITALEIETGILLHPAGKKRKRLEAKFKVLLNDLLGGRVLPFDTHCAFAAAEIAARCHSSGRNIGTRDTQIAGIARVWKAPVATRNVKDFEGHCDVIDPWA